jgi:uncharacterized protein YbbK (DUF523 family)
MISKEQIILNDGTLIVIDNRIFSEVVSAQIEILKRTAQEKILNFCPEYKQRNAAMGLLSPEETTYITSTIQSIRDKCHQLEQRVLDVTWDGTEENRSSACDIVQTTYWD